MRQRIGDGQQQTVGSGQRRSETAGSYQTRDHIGQTGNFRRCQHDQVAANGDFGKLDQTVLVHVDDLHQRRIHRLPVADPGRQCGEGRTDQVVVHHVLGQHGQRGRGEVEQEDEEQRPEYRLARVPHRGGGVVTHQNVRQRGGTHHQTQNQSQEVVALVARGFFVNSLGLGDFLGRRGRVFLHQLFLGALAGERLGVSGNRTRLGLGTVSGFLPFRLQRSSIGREFGDVLLGGGDLLGVGFGSSFHLGQFGFRAGFLLGDESRAIAGGDRFFQRLDLAFPFQLLLLVDGAHGGFSGTQSGGRIVQLLFLGGDTLQRLTVGDLRYRVAGDVHRQPYHRDHVGDDQNDVLRHLGPGHRAHAAEERADQNAGQTGINANFEFQAGETRSDDADAVDLRDHIGEGTDDGGDHADGPGQVAAVACAEEVRDGELAELAQVGRQEQCHQYIAAGPAHDESESVET